MFVVKVVMFGTLFTSEPVHTKVTATDVADYLILEYDVDRIWVEEI